MAIQAVAVSCQAPVLTIERRRDLELRPAIVMIYLALDAAIPSLGLEGSGGLSGTGFLYRPDGYLITNGHVVQIAKANDEEAKNNLRDYAMKFIKDQWEDTHHRKWTDDEKKRINLEIAAGHLYTKRRLIVLFESGQQLDGSIVQYSAPFIDTAEPGKDIAIIKIDANNLPTVPLGDSSTVNVHDDTYVIGYPGVARISNASILTASTTDGIISAVKKMDHSGSPILQTNTMINHGNSGGPAFDTGGKAIGVATFGADPGYNFLVPLSTAMEFVRAAGAEPQHDIGAFDRTWRDALDAYANKQWSRAHQLSNNALEMMPGEPQVLQLQQWAATNERAESPWERMSESMSAATLAGCAALLLLCIGGGVFAVTRPRPVAATAPSAPPEEPAPTPAYVAAANPVQVIEAEQFTSAGSLLISSGPLLGNSFPIPKAGLLIGRDPSRCSVVLPEESVSGEHAWVVPLDNGVAVIDRDSSNGTYINSTDSPRINKVILRHGDRIFLGRKNPTTLTYYAA